MAAPIGNQNAAKGKLWNDALRRAIAQDDRDRVRRAVDKLLDMAAEGEAWAIKELADRLDGKPHQSQSLENADGSPLLAGIQVTFVKPDGSGTASNSEG
jgi:ribosome-binding protein aMBF1 (putative translation factor)